MSAPQLARQRLQNANENRQCVRAHAFLLGLLCNPPHLPLPRDCALSNLQSQTCDAATQLAAALGVHTEHPCSSSSSSDLQRAYNTTTRVRGCTHKHAHFVYSLRSTDNHWHQPAWACALSDHNTDAQIQRLSTEIALHLCTGTRLHRSRQDREARRTRDLSPGGTPTSAGASGAIQQQQGRTSLLWEATSSIHAPPRFSAGREYGSR